MSKKITPTTIGIVLIIVIAVGGLAFYGGMRYGQSRRDAAIVNSQLPGASGTGFGGRGGTSGQITALTTGSMTVTLRDGSTKTITLPGGLAISKSVAGSGSDLSVGETVSVQGAAAADGSITASSVSIRPSTTPAQ